MPLDNRRFNGPEDSVSHKRFINVNLKSYSERCEELLNNNGLRKNGRKREDARFIYGLAGLLTEAKGSAYVEVGHTKLACSVFDPREIPHQNEFCELGNIFCEVKFAPFSCPRKRRPHAPDAEEKALSNELRKALEPAVCRHLFPNYQIDVYVYILEHDGSCLAAAINAAGFALADAAIPMYDTIVACSMAVIGDFTIIDPDESEEHLALENHPNNENHGIITISMLLHICQVTVFSQIGSLDPTCVLNSVDVLKDQCMKVLPNIQTILAEGVKKNVEKHKTELEVEKFKELFLSKKMQDLKVMMGGGG